MFCLHHAEEELSENNIVFRVDPRLNFPVFNFLHDGNQISVLTAGSITDKVIIQAHILMESRILEYVTTAPFDTKT